MLVDDSIRTFTSHRALARVAQRFLRWRSEKKNLTPTFKVVVNVYIQFSILLLQKIEVTESNDIIGRPTF